MNRKVSETKTSNGIKIKYLFNQNRKQINPNSLEDLDVCHYSIPNVQEFGKGVIENGTDIESNKFLIEHEQLLVSKLNPRKQTVCLSHPEETVTVCSTEFISLYPKEKNVDLNYSRYVFMMSETTELLDSMVESVTRSHQRIQPEKFENLYFPLPPLDEQKLISRYLDKKTEQIDSLIEKIQKKIELLKEQRTSLINQCVTKGIDPNVEMKDSGVEWIGEIPKYWTIVKIGHYSKIIRGSSPRPAGDPSLFGGSLIPWITVGEVTNQKTKYILSTQNFLTEEGSRQSTTVVPGTLLLSNSGATLGVPRFTNIEGCINDGSVAFLNIRSTLLPDFLYWFLTTQTVRLLKQQSGFGQPNLNTEIVSNLKITLPTLEEQREIVSEIETTVGKTNSIVEIESRRLELFTEYRQSLISSVVTGKVRVTEDMI